MTSPPDNQPSDELSDYLQAYLDETEEELEVLVQSLLTLEENPRDIDALNEAFRMMHSLKGSSGLMGFEGIGELAHQLEHRFDRFRSGDAALDRATINVMLDCLDFFRIFTTRLRAGEPVEQDGSAFVTQLEELESGTSSDPAEAASLAPAGLPGHITLGGGICVRVTFRKGLQLADLKAKLIIARLSNIGEIVGSDPPIDDVLSTDGLPQFVVIVATDRSPEEVKSIASVDGVESVEIQSPGSAVSLDESATDPTPRDVSSAVQEQPAQIDVSRTFLHQSGAEAAAEQTEGFLLSSDGKSAVAANASESADVRQAGDIVPRATSPLPPAASTDPSRQRVAETVRVDIARLDRLMNLTGELVVTNARFDQLFSRMSPALRSSRGAGRMSELSERLREGFDRIRRIGDRLSESGNWQPILDELADDLRTLQDESALWNEGHRCFSQVAEAIHQLSRVSQNLQQGVLETRMTPVGPLLGRFNRVIRDLSQERNKKVQLVIRGEKTELDKRMIDELGDPLLHLIRNSIDHGFESPDDRRRAGKSETGTIVLEASHSGNNVFVSVQDDGAGIDVEKVRAGIVERNLADPDLAAAMSEQEVINHIWHPGFSTADQVTEISGRGVGMDIVNSRIGELNGSIEVSTEPGSGTTFLLRLPLTLAIIRSLVIRFQNTFFSIPIDDVREIVSVPVDQVYSIHGRQAIDVRGEFVPLSGMGQVFAWHDIDYSYGSVGNRRTDGADPTVANVVILQSRGKTLGLRVDELLGGADIVMKSLADNFISIRGLSGASIMGEGAVCLMLDTTAIIEMM